jgi:sterol 14-demethylase
MLRASSPAHSLNYLLLTPTCSDALYQEQVDNFSNDDGTFRTMTYEEFKKLPLLDAIIRETLRRHPPIHSIWASLHLSLPTLLA